MQVYCVFYFWDDDKTTRSYMMQKPLGSSYVCHDVKLFPNDRKLFLEKKKQGYRTCHTGKTPLNYHSTNFAATPRH